MQSYSTNKLNTEDRITQAALHTFLLYGYHATTVRQIANVGGIHKSSVHYYFRSKEKLYAKVVAIVLENVLKMSNDRMANQHITKKQKWFLFTELYNNQKLFEETLKKLYPNDWDEKLRTIKELLQIKEERKQ